MHFKQKCKEKIKHIKIIRSKAFSCKAELFLLTGEKALQDYLLPLSQVYILLYFVSARTKI